MIATSMEIESGNGYYSPTRISHWLRSWDALTAKAEHAGSVAIGSHGVGQGRTDPLSWADVQADILTAWDALEPMSRAFRLVYLVMQGYSVEAAGSLLRPRLDCGGASLVYWHGCKEMAQSLGWRN